MSSFRLYTLFAAALAGLVATRSPANADAFTVSFEGPGVQSADSSALCSGFGSGNCVVGVESFSGRHNGSFTTSFGTGGVITGTYSGVQIRPADQYGGAGGTGNYVVTFSSTGYGLDLSTTLPSGINYFGYWLSALDNGNVVQFFRGNTEVFRFSPGDLIALLGACPNNYCGNPNVTFLGRNGSQLYAFLNFTDNTGTFDRIVYSEDPSSGGYESDNHTVGFVTGISGTPIATPEPASLFTLLGGMVLTGLLTRRIKGRR